MYPAGLDPKMPWDHLLTVDDFEQAARTILPKMAYDYYRSGADAEETLRRNRRAFRHYAIYYRVLVDVTERDLRASLFGTDLSSPILVAPTAYHRMAHPDGEQAAARAAARAGTIFTLSTLATTTIEDVAAASSGPKWFQLYVHKDKGLTRALIQRAEASGFRAIVLTVDAPILGRRLADERNGFALPEGMSMANLAAHAASIEGRAEKSSLARFMAARHDPSLSFRDLEGLQAETSLPLLLKGVVRADDAARAIEHGVRGIVVSNHGARQLDSAPASLDALPGVVEAVAGRCPVLFDGGVRWGTDVLKALALGATAVLIGRPLLWGLTVGGEDGALRVLEILKGELSHAMALAGCPTLASIDRDLVRRVER